jgi:ubiquinone/menaquinone biosynthesis C-methylase UbiE
MTMVRYEWNEQRCREYADGMRPMVRFDHKRWARMAEQDLRAGGLGRGAITILDVACGPAFLLLEAGQRLPRARLVAQDASETMLRIAEEEAARYGRSIETVRCPAEELDLEDASVDVATCKQLLHEVRAADRVISELARVVRPGGRAYVIDFDADGSRLMAGAIRLMLRLTRGREVADSMWSSFRAGLPGARVRDLLLAAGFDRADYRRAGMNYFVVGVR